MSETLKTGNNMRDNHKTTPGDKNGGRKMSEVIICAIDKLKQEHRKN